MSYFKLELNLNLYTMDTASLCIGLTFTRFYPYESVHLMDRIISLENYEDYKALKQEIKRNLGFDLSKAPWKEVGFKNHCRLQWDNKITFQAVTRNGFVCYIQFYDNHCHIGLSVEKRNYNPETHYLEILSFKKLKISGKV